MLEVDSLGIKSGGDVNLADIVKSRLTPTSLFTGEKDRFVM